MGSGPGRGGYPHQGGRGRGYSSGGYQGQMSYSPGTNFRQTPNQPRGGMGPQFHGPNQNRPLGPFPNSPHQANRSPALANAHPTTPQMNPVPMAHPSMPPQPFAYGQHMPQPVRNPPYSNHNSNHSAKPARRGYYNNNYGRTGNRTGSSGNNTASGNGNSRFKEMKREPVVQPSGPVIQHTQPTAQPSFPAVPVDLAPESGNFERFLTMVKHEQGYSYDPNYGAYYPQNPYAMQGGYMPPSPQPRPGVPFTPQPGFMHGQYPVQPPPQSTPLSRTPSQVSTDRPGSSLGQGSGAPAAGHAHTGSRSSNSPAPGPAKSAFVIPTKKSSAAIIIKDPSGAVKTFGSPASPARATPSPVKIATPTSTPPPRTASASDHARTDSKAAAKTDEEKKQELKDAVRQKIEADAAAQKREAEEAARKTAEDSKKKDVSTDADSAADALQDLSLKDKAAPAAAAAAAEEPKKADAPAPAAPADDDEIDFDAIEREMAEIEAKERAAEEDYNRKKQEKKEAEAKKEKEELENYEANMKKAEREAEERELAREAARAKGETATTEDDASRKEREDLFASLKKGGFAATETSTPGDSGAATPVSSEMGPPGKPASATSKKPTGLKLDTPKPTEPLQPTAAMKSLQNAKFLEDLAKVIYPAGISAPNAELNANAPAGRRFHYDRDFLLQFQTAFKDKPSIDWDIRIRETLGDPERSAAGGRTPSTMSRNPSRNASNPGFPMGGPIGTFSQPNRNSMPGGMGRGGFQFPGGRGPMGVPGMIRGSNPMASPIRGSNSKSGRVDSSKRGKPKNEGKNDASMPLTAGMKLEAITTSASGWKPRSVGQGVSAGPAPGGDGHMAPDVVQRKVKAALNKMTPEKFDRISVQILEIVSQSKDESDGRTLRQVIQLTFEKATDEAHWAPMYAKFCKAMLESMSADIKDENIRDKNGNVVAGGSLFRKYLLNRCQEEFERGWKVNLPEKPEGQTEEAQILSDEY